eukprot:CAMPEP_0201510610 /NCGR_PEP_ID=MMETSP0161_2-20130828/3225_1 /ASSEMBLY_ACC=CAM_ASM_000251 /TAXON_ID=180227 /ORGANISM="Neoparamoeba aestuarina, Strain SoJaBio B1-5/56/2" /LENGTH=473 /DNA_ID=CAMNT_0047905801 /DNA_START=65 /DNA_END=1486 /DNA_ORIENTATION=-
MSDSPKKEDAPKHGVGDRGNYYDHWSKLAREEDENRRQEEEEITKEIEEKIAQMGPMSEAEKKDKEKRAALAEAKKTWDAVKADNEAKKFILSDEKDIKERTIPQSELKERTVLVLKDNSGCSYHLPNGLTLTKIFIEDCTDCSFVLHCKLASSTIELCRCTNVSVKVMEAPIHTIQVDLSSNINLFYAKGLFNEEINSKVYHSKVKDLKIEFDHLGTGEDQKIQQLDDFELESLHASLNPSSSSSAVSSIMWSAQNQFVTQFLAKEGDLVTDLVLRDALGHPCTMRETEARKHRVEMAAKSKGLDLNDPQVQKIMHEYDPVTPLDTSVKYKEKGNAAFGERDYGQAGVYYSQAVEILEPISKNENWGVAKEGEGEEVSKGRELLCAVLSNRAACNLKLGNHPTVLADTDACLELDPAHVKGLFRKGLALHALGRYREACPVLGKALKLQPKNSQIKTALTFAERKAAMPDSK